MALDSELQTQIRDFLGILRKRRWQIVLPALYVITIGTAFAVIVPKKYHVSMQIELRSSQFNTPQESTVSSEVPAVEFHIRNYSRVREVIDREGDLWSDYVNADDVGRHRQIQTVLDNLSAQELAKRRQQGSTFIEITYADVDGQRAERFLNDLSERWIGDVLQADERKLQSQRDLLQEELIALTEECNRANTQYTRLQQELSVDPTQPVSPTFPSAGDAYYARKRQAEQDLAQVEQDLVGLEAEIRSLTQSWELEPAEMSTPVVGEGTSFARDLAVLDLRLEELTAEQQKLLPAHSRYEYYTREITAIQEKLRLLRANEREAPTNVMNTPNLNRVELARQISERQALRESLLARRKTLIDDIDVLSTDTARRTEQYSLLAQIGAERDYLERIRTETNVELYRVKSKLQGMQESWEEPYQIAEPPIAADAQRRPNALLLIGFAVFAGLALGLGIALLAEYGRNSYRTASDLAEVMTIPVLGTINSIVTRDEARRAHMRRSLVGLSSAVILGSLTWFTWVWSYTPDKLPTGVKQVIDGIREKLM